MNLNELSRKAYETAMKRGQYRGDIKDAILHLFGEVTELSQATKHANYGMYEQLIEKMGYKESYELAIKNTIECEIADIIILTAGLAHCLGIDLDLAIKMKMKYNETRI